MKIGKILGTALTMLGNAIAEKGSEMTTRERQKAADENRRQQATPSLSVNGISASSLGSKKD